MRDDGGVIPAKRTVAAGTDAEASQRMLRKLGYGLLIAAVTLDVVASTRDKWKRAVALQYSKMVDDVLPEENVLLEVALGILGQGRD